MKDSSKISALNVLSCLIVTYLVCKAGYMIANVVSFSLAANIPVEGRDSVQFRVAQAFLAGSNPYSLEALSAGTVPLVYMYTFLQPLCVAVVCKIFGIGILAGNFTVLLLCIWGTTLCIWLIVRESIGNNTFWGGGVAFTALLLTVGTFFTMLKVPFFTFRPDAIGILLSSVLLLIMYKCPHRVILSAFVTVTLIHTKQILVVMALPIFIYYLLNNTNYAVKYFIACLIITIAEFVIIRLIFPIYWGASIYSLSTTINGSRLSTALINIAIFCVRYIAFILLGLAGVVVMLREKTGSYWTRIKSWLSDMRHEYIMLLILNITLSLVFLLYCARNSWDGRKYCHDMLAPSVIILSVLVWKYAVPSLSRLSRSILVFMICCAAFCSLMLGRLTYRTLTIKDICAYSELWETIQQHDNGSPVFLGAISSIYVTGRQDSLKDYIYFDDGHIEYQDKTSPHTKISSFLLIDDIYDAGRKYVQTINQMVREKKFSMIVQDYGNIINEEALSENYREIKQLEFRDAVVMLDTSTARIYVPR